MDWLVWVLVVAVVLAIIFVWFAVARRRSRVGGVLAAPEQPRRRRGRGPAAGDR
jgi:cytochrome c-type biogenesis protein CcmH/NrfF